MAELLLVANPKRRRKKNPRHRHRRRSNPRYHHRRRRRSNPHRHHYRRRRNPVMRYRRHRRHRNPSFRGIVGQVMPTFKAGLVGASGALMLDAAWGYINPNLPASISGSPYLQYAVKALAAVAVGMVGGKLLRGKGTALAVGGMTVATHDLLKSVLTSAMPTVFGPGGTLALSGYGHMGAYLSGSAPIVGTAAFPRAPVLQSAGGGLGAYLSGDVASGAGVYTDDTMGEDPWGGIV